VVVAAGSILASIYNTMNERRREFAILRALGARRSTVFSAIVLVRAGPRRSPGLDPSPLDQLLDPLVDRLAREPRGGRDVGDQITGVLPECLEDRPVDLVARFRRGFVNQCSRN
jgi:hypothetical protein